MPRKLAGSCSECDVLAFIHSSAPGKHGAGSHAHTTSSSCTPASPTPRGMSSALRTIGSSAWTVREPPVMRMCLGTSVFIRRTWNASRVSTAILGLSTSSRTRYCSSGLSMLPGMTSSGPISSENKVDSPVFRFDRDHRNRRGTAGTAQRGIATCALIVASVPAVTYISARESMYTDGVGDARITIMEDARACRPVLSVIMTEMFRVPVTKISSFSMMVLDVSGKDIK